MTNISCATVLGLLLGKSGAQPARFGPKHEKKPIGEAERRHGRCDATRRVHSLQQPSKKGHRDVGTNKNLATIHICITSTADVTQTNVRDQWGSLLLGWTHGP